MNCTTLEVAGFIPALHGMRNPWESWNKTDSSMNDGKVIIGKNDLELAQKLIAAGSEHCKFLRMIQVWADINMPRYWWSEFDTYHFNTKNSTSTMHKLLNREKEITEEMFVIKNDNDISKHVIEQLEQLRQEYRKNPNNELLIRAKRILPEGFLQMRTVNTNYSELRNIYFQRKNHRLKEEWQEVFCKWIETLPYARELITYTGGL